MDEIVGGDVRDAEEVRRTTSVRTFAAVGVAEKHPLDIPALRASTEGLPPTGGGRHELMEVAPISPPPQTPPSLRHCHPFQIFLFSMLRK
ncbi:hypothetical protein U1Q18_014923, partial [Sarracenia purpurea var. burkii]